ncbi:MAG TPA: MFS transporter [Alphaproteobacteria bacterium]|nr:MFS transporter [Alphaproteobacteria bacterium]
MPGLPLLFLVAFLVGADEFLLGPILTPIGADLAVAPERVALFVAAYSLPLAILAPIFGALSDRYGRLAVLVPAAAVFGCASIATSLVGSFEAGLASRIVTGAASGGMLSIAFAFAADRGGERAARGIAVVTSGLTLGIIVSPGIGALAAETLSWRAAFAGLGGLALLVAVAAAVGLRAEDASRRTVSAEAAGPLFVPGAAGSLTAMALGLGGAVGIFALVGERLRDLYGAETAAIGLVYAGFGISTLLGNLAMPWAVGRFGSGRRAMRIALVAVLAAIVVTYAMDGIGLALAGLALLAWAVLGGLGAPALQSHIAGLSPARRGTLMALAGSALNLGVAASSALAAFVYGHAAHWVAMLGVVLLGGAILALRPANGRAAAADPLRSPA